MANQQSKGVILNIYKKAGETPLEALVRFKKNNLEYKDVPLTYAGRLDPLASGVLVVVGGDEIQNKEKYLGLEKEYMCRIIWGMATDTYDVLGLITHTKSGVVTIGELKKVMEDMLDRLEMNYPPYSSKPVGGKPLFEWAREGKLSEIVLPKRQVEIFEFAHTDTQMISKEALSHNIEDKITPVKGDFRQEQSLRRWREYFDATYDNEFRADTFRVHCSSGTYIREIVNVLSQELNVPATLLDLVRTRVGEFKIEEAVW